MDLPPGMPRRTLEMRGKTCSNNWECDGLDSILTTASVDLSGYLPKSSWIYRLVVFSVGHDHQRRNIHVIQWPHLVSISTLDGANGCWSNNCQVGMIIVGACR